jgi:hypothetical protein
MQNASAVIFAQVKTLLSTTYVHAMEGIVTSSRVVTKTIMLHSALHVSVKYLRQQSSCWLAWSLYVVNGTTTPVAVRFLTRCDMQRRSQHPSVRHNSTKPTQARVSARKSGMRMDKSVLLCRIPYERLSTFDSATTLREVSCAFAHRQVSPVRFCCGVPTNFSNLTSTKM